MTSNELAEHRRVLKRLSEKAALEGRREESIQLLQAWVAMNNLFEEYHTVLETMLEYKKEVEGR